MRVGIPLLMVILLVSNIVSASSVFTVEEGEMWVDCNDCIIEISKDDTILANGSNYVLDVDQGQIELESYGEEDYILVLPIKKIGPISDLLRCKIAIISTSLLNIYVPRTWYDSRRSSYIRPARYNSHRYN